jgi:hypothetical protein
MTTNSAIFSAREFLTNFVIEKTHKTTLETGEEDEPSLLKNSEQVKRFIHKNIEQQAVTNNEIEGEITLETIRVEKM